MNLCVIDSDGSIVMRLTEFVQRREVNFVLKIRKFIIAVFTALVALPAASEDKFRPLSEALAQESSPHMINYVMQRCSGLMMEMAQRTERGGEREGSQQLIDFMMMGYETFAMQSAELTTQIKGRSAEDSSISLSEVLDTVLMIKTQYFEDMEAHYRLTGNALSPQVQEDLSLCVSVIKGE